jgi:hypothetical protein
METFRLADTGALLEVARTLTPLQREILLSLRDKGPGALLEVAVRVLKFPDDVRQPLAGLRDKGLVTWSDRSETGVGGEVISLTADGARLTGLLRDQAFIQQVDLAAGPAAAPSFKGPLQQQADLLQKLGDLAVSNGDVDGAKNYYQQALEVSQRLSAPDS